MTIDKLNYQKITLIMYLLLVINAENSVCFAYFGGWLSIKYSIIIWKLNLLWTLILVCIYINLNFLHILYLLTALYYNFLA